MSDQVPVLPVDVLPGDLIAAACPEGSKPPLKVGQGLPAEKPLFSVARIEGNKVFLGPLKGGILESDIPCGADASIHFAARVVEVKKEDLPERQPPLAPEALGYPLWLWIAIGLVVASFVGLVFGIWKRLRNKEQNKNRRPPAPVRNPDEKFEIFVRTATKERLPQRDAHDAIRRLYADGYEHLRGFLEFRLEFRSPEATTREFVGELRTALMRYNAKVAAQPAQVPGEEGARRLKKVDSAVIGTIESLLLQADQVRFASEAPPMDNREAFLKNLDQLRSTI